jgi:hypothetical protein
VRLWFDMAQVRAFIEDERAMRRSSLAAFKLTMANFGTLFWLYFRISFLAWLGLGLGLWFWIRLSGGAAVIMLQIVLLWWVATRLWQRASEVAWYQRARMLSSGAPARDEICAPAAEATAIAQDPFSPDE